MMHPSEIVPDVELCNFLKGKISSLPEDGSMKDVTVYSDWEQPTNMLPDDFIVIYINGDIDGIGLHNDFAKGYIIVGLYCKLNDDGSVKKNRIKKILEQFDILIEKCITENYFFEYDFPRFITPTTPNQTSGYSVTNLNLRWHTKNNFNKESI